jgi:hypothetical protein
MRADHRRRAGDTDDLLDIYFSGNIFPLILLSEGVNGQVIYLKAGKAPAPAYL